MKIEVEVTEAEMKDAIARHLRTAVADRVNNWGASQKIKDIVAAEYDETVRKVVKEMLNDAPKIRQQVQESLVAKIRGQLTAAMKSKV